MIFCLKVMFYNIFNYNFASVFHGIRFKVRRLFVAMTSNFFCACAKGGLFSPRKTNLEGAGRGPKYVLRA